LYGYDLRYWPEAEPNQTLYNGIASSAFRPKADGAVSMVVALQVSSERTPRDAIGVNRVG